MTLGLAHEDAMPPEPWPYEPAAAPLALWAGDVLPDYGVQIPTDASDDCPLAVKEMHR